MSTVLGVPMILYYRNNRSLHWLCFNLQFAAAIALAVGEYTKILDLSKPSSLRQFKVLNFFTFITMLWTRFIHWSYLCFDLYITWWQDKAYVFLFIGLLLSLGFSAFSFLCCVKPFYKNWVKFLNVAAVYENLPEDAPPEKRRASVVKLDEAVSSLLDGDGMLELADMVEKLFERRTPERRQSMPLQRRKRFSLAVAHPKSFGYDGFGYDKGWKNKTI